MHITGIVIGWLIVTGYLFAVMNFIVKRINKNIMSKKPIDSLSRKRFVVFMRIFTKGHIYVGLYLVTIILLHFLIEVTHEGFFITGLITGTLILTQISIGAYGAFIKDRKKGSWLILHRSVSLLLALAITTHVLSIFILHVS